jgi:hypothetical protein
VRHLEQFGSLDYLDDATRLGRLSILPVLYKLYRLA